MGYDPVRKHLNILNGHTLERLQSATATDHCLKHILMTMKEESADTGCDGRVIDASCSGH